MTVHNVLSMDERISHTKELQKNTDTITNGISDVSIHQFEISHIAHHFIYNYYNIMSLEPEKLHLFYGDDSCLSFGIEGDQNTKDCNGSSSIHEHFISLGLKNSNISIITLNFQPSIEGCILVHIIGDLIKSTTRSEQFIDTPATIKFVQSFVLARQHNGYYVLNDCMYYIRIPIVLQRFPCAHESISTHKLGFTPTMFQTWTSLENSTTNIVSKFPIDGHCSLNSPLVEEPIATNVDGSIDIIESKHESPTCSNLTSWASLVSSKTQFVTPTPNNTPVKCSIVDSTDLCLDGTQSVSKNQHVNTRQYGSGSAHIDLSVFIKGIQCYMTPSDVLPLLETFGKVTYIDIVVEKNCAFANFKNPSEAKAAIGQVIHVKGCDLTIEQRKFKYGQRAPRYTQDGFQYSSRDIRRKHDDHRHTKRGHDDIDISAI